MTETTTIALTVIKDQCLGHLVYRGSAPADLLVQASWIDFLDQDSNPRGYQRPFDKTRSNRAANYANNEENGFWPECVLAVRSNGEVEDEDEKVFTNFTAVGGTNDRFGTLEITYNPAGTILIQGQEVPWRRALSQVDCQHRLGALAGSKREVTFCIFPELKRRDEAIIFRTINASQRRVNTSLVDAIILLTDSNPPVHLKWAWDLGNDPGSPLSQRVYAGGRGRPPGDYLVNLAGLKSCLQILMPSQRLGKEDTDLWYLFARNFWGVVAALWPIEFENKSGYKLQTLACQLGLAQFGQQIFRKALPTQNMTQEFIRSAFHNDGTRVDWGLRGPLQLATGKGGQRQVFQYLVERYGDPLDQP